MFKKLHFNHHEARKEPAPNSLQYVTPNSRMIPLASTESLSPYGPGPTNTNSPHFSYYSYAEESSLWDHLGHSERQSQVSRSTFLQAGEDDRFGRDSIIDPEQAIAHSPGLFPAGGVSRGTYIEPNMSSVHHTMVHLNESHVDDDVSDVRYDHGRLAVDTSSPEIRTISPPTPVKSRLKQAEILPRMHHALLVESPREAEKTLMSASTPAIVLAPSKSASGSSLSSNSSRHHPQPLPPLQIPITPIRSHSSPSHPIQRGLPGSSASSGRPFPYQDSPHYLAPSSTRSPYGDHLNESVSPGGLTPASTRSGTSPLTPSPRTPSPQGISPSSSLGKLTPSMAEDTQVEDLVVKGIKYHESGQLEKATKLFHEAALKDSPIAMFLYGVSLRHGWGVAKNEYLAFQYLQKAAEHAVLDLNRLSNTFNTSASKGELIMAIYELGVSFRHGWGCQKNKETAVYFFKIAADLGDADAQNDLGHCYYHGHGVKKDLHLAAKYYRKADKQGQGIMGNSWIWKSKYDNPKH